MKCVFKNKQQRINIATKDTKSARSSVLINFPNTFHTSTDYGWSEEEDIYTENPFVVVPLFILWRWNNRSHLTSSEIRISEFGKNSTKICPKLELLWRN